MPSRTRKRASKWKVPLLFAGSFLLLYFICSITGVLEFYNVQSESNEPSIKRNKSLLASVLRKPSRNDFIVYSHAQTAALQGNDDYLVHRLCGVPGDTLLIKDGILFVNGQNIDEELQLKHKYRISSAAYMELQSHGKQVFSEDNSLTEDSIDLLLPDNIACDESHFGRRLVMPEDYVDERIKQQFHQQWNQDQFGPLVVPTGSYFVLADNRNASDDSRFTGFVPIKNWKRTVLSH
jgi:signal peptidase I